MAWDLLWISYILIWELNMLEEEQSVIKALGRPQDSKYLTSEFAGEIHRNSNCLSVG